MVYIVQHRIQILKCHTQIIMFLHSKAPTVNRFESTLAHQRYVHTVLPHAIEATTSYPWVGTFIPNIIVHVYILHHTIQHECNSDKHTHHKRTSDLISTLRFMCNSWNKPSILTLHSLTIKKTQKICLNTKNFIIPLVVSWLVWLISPWKKGETYDSKYKQLHVIRRMWNLENQHKLMFFSL